MRIAGLLSLIAVLLAVLASIERISPGPLSPTHAQRSELGGNAGCRACHGDRGTEMSTACLACHAEVGEAIELARGVHGRLAPATARDCGACHGEHHGAELALVTRSSFALVGIEDPAAFDHAGLDWRLTGRHLALGCEACHPNAHAGFLADGATRFLGLAQACTECHADPHAGEFGAGCATCHGEEEPFERVAEFEHDALYPLRGPHAVLACRECHASEGTFAIAALIEGSSPSRESRDSCSDCHVSPHSEAFLARVSKELGELPDESCSSCHHASAETFAEGRMTPELHAASGFVLAPPHDDVECRRCHANEGSAEILSTEHFALAHPGRARENCASCHGDPHAGQFAGPALAGARSTPKTCLDCHDALSFVPARFGAEEHAALGFPLRDSHAQVDCSGCHARVLAPQGSRVFRGTSQECANCHADPHGGEFTAGPFASEGCAGCHDERAFRPTRFDLGHHARTRFPLDGAHAAVACGACHTSAEAQRGAALTPSASRFDRAESDCAACHADVHDGSFDRRGLEARVDGRESCARCHGTASFASVLRERFDHARWTDFELDGAHAAVQCVACHRPGPVERAAGRNFGTARGTTCAACHADPHVGQFATTTGSECARCHSPSSEFRADRFEHSSARFALDDRHTRLACSACHTVHALAGGGTAVRYKPLGIDCADCHDPGTAIGGQR